MNGKRRIRLSYANVVASLALFAALGGSSYAAISITGKQVRDGSLSGRDVRDRSLVAKDFKAGQLPAGPQGPKGDPGAPGPAGPKGDPGATGASGLSDVEVVDTVSATDSTSPKWVFPQCPAGKRAIAAGGEVSPQAADLGKVILERARLHGSSAALVGAVEVAGANPGNWTLTGFVTCAYVQ